MSKLTGKRYSMITIKKMTVAECENCGKLIPMSEYTGVCPVCGVWNDFLRVEVGKLFTDFQDELINNLSDYYLEYIGNVHIPDYKLMCQKMKDDIQNKIDELETKIHAELFNRRTEQ